MRVRSQALYTCAVALYSLIADVPVDANLEKALSPVVDPIVQYIVSTPVLATPLARLLGVNSQLVSCCRVAPHAPWLECGTVHSVGQILSRTDHGKTSSQSLFYSS